LLLVDEDFVVEKVEFWKDHKDLFVVDLCNLKMVMLVFKF
jgi:hypothetical protein